MMFLLCFLKQNIFLFLNYIYILCIHLLRLLCSKLFLLRHFFVFWLLHQLELLELVLLLLDLRNHYNIFLHLGFLQMFLLWNSMFALDLFLLLLLCCFLLLYIRTIHIFWFWNYIHIFVFRHSFLYNTILILLCYMQLGFHLPNIILV